MKVDQLELLEMAAKQTCSKCGKSPIYKTHSWIGGGWKCRGESRRKSSTPTDATREPTIDDIKNRDPGAARKNHVTDAGARSGIEHLFKK